MRKLLLFILLLPLFANSQTPVFCCGFECGQLGTVGQHFIPESDASISTSIVRSGARSLRLNPSSSSNGRARVSTMTSSEIHVIRAYVYFITLPSVNFFIFNSNSNSAYFNQADSKIYARAFTTLGASGVTVTTGVWYLIDFIGNNSANPWRVDVKVNGVSCGQATNAAAPQGTTNPLEIGSSSTTTADVYIDDVAISYTSADYPIGAGYVNHFVAISDGVHTSTGTTTAKGTLATPVGAAITSATTDAFNWVNGVPLLGGATDNTRLINAVSNASTTYAEVVFGPAPGISTPTTAPRAVEVITADRQASTATGNFTVKLNDNGTEDNVVARGSVAGVTTDRYVRKHYATAPTGGAWTVVSGAGNFNNIRARFGYSSDAAPDQYWRGIMIEAEFAEVTLTVPGTPGDKRHTTLGVGMIAANEKIKSKNGIEKSYSYYDWETMEAILPRNKLLNNFKKQL